MLAILSCLTKMCTGYGGCRSVSLLRRKFDDGNTDLFDKDVCQVRLLQLSETAHHLLHITGAQVLLDGGHRCCLVAHSFCLTP